MYLKLRSSPRTRGPRLWPSHRRIDLSFYVYILASQRNGTLYIGSTDDLARRVWEHREKVRAGFSTKYDVTKLVWYEVHESREAAFQRERRMKKWNRIWKIELIEQLNPGWHDLYERLNG